MPHLSDEDERNSLNWKEYGLPPVVRAARFINELTRFQNSGDRVSLEFIERWVVQLIYAVTSDRIVSMDPDYRETTCLVCGTKIFCCHTADLQATVKALRDQLESYNRR